LNVFARETTVEVVELVAEVGDDVLAERLDVRALSIARDR